MVKYLFIISNSLKMDSKDISCEIAVLSYELGRRLGPEELAYVTEVLEKIENYIFDLECKIKRDWL